MTKCRHNTGVLHNLTYASDINSIVGPLQSSCTRRREQKDLGAYVLSLVRPSPSSIKGNTLSPNRNNRSTSRGSVHSHTTTEPLGSNLEHTLKHSAHVGAPVTLDPSDQSPTRPLAPPIFLPSVCNPTANFEHLGSGIKSPTDSNWT